MRRAIRDKRLNEQRQTPCEREVIPLWRTDDPRTLRRALIEADLVDTAQRDRAFLQSEAKMQVVSEAKDNMVALPGQLFRGQFPDVMPVSKRIQSLDTRRQSALIGHRY